MAKSKALQESIAFSNRDRDFSIIISLVFLLEVLTFKNFFFLNPADASSAFIGFQRTIFDIGWFAFIFLTPLTLSLSLSPRVRNGLFLVSWVIWPISLVVIHVSSLITDQNLYLDYLVTYPIFIFTDVLAPAFYGVVWYRNRAEKVS